MNQASDKTDPIFNELVSKAKKGDLRSSFKILNDHDSGALSLADQSLYEIISKLFINQIKKHKIKVCNVKLLDFRVFRDTGFSLSKNNTTILFGNNGVGKSSILDAVAKTLTWISFNIRNKNTKGRGVEIKDININTEFDYASIISEISIGNRNKFIVEITKSKEGVGKKKSSVLEDVRLIANMYRKAANIDSELELPFFAYYPVERSYNSRSDLFKKNIPTKNENDRFEAYIDSFDGSANFDSFIGWYKYIDSLINQHEKNEINNNLNELEEKIKKNDISELALWLIESKNKSAKKTILLQKKLDIVKLAIKNFIPYIEDIIIDLEAETEMFVLKKDINNSLSRISVSQLSQGERSLMALIADISRRLIVLNPNKAAPLESSGIVLIDEIDLHLHPEWQQVAVSNLTKTFPNIQFLLTTHSPQVLSSVINEDIRKLSNGKVLNIIVKTYGEDSSVILEDVMSVSSKPKTDDNILLENYLIMINNGEIYSDNVIKIRERLNSVFGENNSDLLIADMLINKWKSLIK